MTSAKPPDTGTGAPSGVVPSANWTVPVASKGATFARKTTGMPWNAERGNTVSVVVVAAVPDTGGGVGVSVGAGVGVTRPGVGVGVTGPGVGVGVTGPGVGVPVPLGMTV